MPGYLDILKRYDKNKWIVSKNHLSKLSKISKIFLHHPFSATMLDSISLKTPTIEIWKELKLHQDPLDTYGKLKLLVAAKDKKILQSGVYLIFAINSVGTPSEGKIVYLG